MTTKTDKASSRIESSRSATDFVKNNRWHLVVAVFLVLLMVWSFVKIDRPAYENPEGGDTLSYTPFSDYLTLLAARQFHEEGFTENYFLANMTVGYPEFARGWYAYQTPLPEVPNASIYYTHYGSFDALREKNRGNRSLKYHPEHQSKVSSHHDRLFLGKDKIPVV